MPYLMKQEGEQTCIYKAGPDDQPEGETLGCHPSKEDAQKQMAALMAKESDMMGKAAAAKPQTRILGAYLERKLETAQAEPGSVMRFVASTEAIVRDGGIIRAEGWQLDNYRANPVVLWAHDYASLPIGRADVEVRDGKLMADVTFDQADEFARQVEGKYQRGFLNTVSVGWETIEFEEKRSTPEGARWVSARQDLLDISAVPVPADPGALAERQRRALAQLGQALAQLGDSQPAETGELDWQEVAAAMVRCLTPTSDEPEEARLSAYKALLPKYRRLSKVAPEYLDAATLSALGPAERRGLFLAGEPDLLPDAFALPEALEGADDGVLTATAIAEIQVRLSALEERPRIAEQRILAGILAKLQAAQPEPPAPTRAAGGDDGNEQSVISDRPSQSLQAILEKLESLT